MSKVLLEKLSHSASQENSLHFVEPKGSLPHPQGLASGVTHRGISYSDKFISINSSESPEFCQLFAIPERKSS
jgi:hypothetical protein